MFSPLRGFEDALRLELEWQGQRRFVLARLQLLPVARRQVVVVCEFENAPHEGRWLVLHGVICEPLHINKPKNIPKLRRIVLNAFSGRGLHIARLLELDEPAPPQIALLTPSSIGFWRFDWNEILWRDRSQKSAAFVFDAPAAPGEDEAHEHLLRAWNDESSDARFAWNWLQLSRDEKMARLCGYAGDWSELRRVMRLVLLCTAEIWNRGDVWGWSLHPQFASRGHLINASNRRDNSPNARFATWQEWLFARFVPDFQEAILEQHVCAKEFWRDAETLESVRIDAPPTMHERLEARLELREWLQNKATPNEIARLL